MFFAFAFLCGKANRRKYDKPYLSPLASHRNVVLPGLGHRNIGNEYLVCILNLAWWGVVERRNIDHHTVRRVKGYGFVPLQIKGSIPLLPTKEDLRIKERKR